MTPSGFREAYARFVEGGWMGLSAPVEVGGQGLPNSLSAAMMEDFNAANVAFALCPMLGLGAVDAIEAHGSEELKRDYLPKIVSGEWTATMNLTEPQAGSDVGALKSRAIPAGDGSWRIIRHQDFHHLWRARPHRQYRPHGPCPHAGCAGGHQGHLAFPRSEGPARRRVRTTSIASRSSTRWASMPRRLA